MKNSFKTALIAAVVSAFVAAGAAVATTQTFVLGTTNTVDAASTVTAGSSGLNAKMLQLRNNNTGSSATALALTTPGSRPPMIVSSAAKVANLNADKLDGIDSAGFLRNTVPLSLTGSTAGDGVITGTNTGAANGVQGVTGGSTSSGVYGQNNGSGFGVAGRANSPGGVGVYAESLGGGPALVIQTAPGAPPMSVGSSAKVNNLNADQVDGLDPSSFVVGDPGGGGRLLANRFAPAAAGQVLLGVPGMGQLIVDKCDGSVGGVRFNTAGTGPVDLMYSGLVSNNPGRGGLGDMYSIITNQSLIPTPSAYGAYGPTTLGAYTLNIARDTGLGTKIATIWVSWDADGCRFQAHMLQSPQL
jgi:hypothetical protein